MTLLEPSKPIEIPDDGLRYVRHGETKRGNFPFICLENPAHIAYVVAVRKQKQMTKQTNIKRWS
jgi:hypothetical protein